MLDYILFSGYKDNKIMTDAYDYHTVPNNSMGMTKGEYRSIKWDYFWQLFRNHSAWDLEYNDGGGWISCKEDLTVTKEYPIKEVLPNGLKIYNREVNKITLDFTSSHNADYRLTFAIDVKVKEYVEKVAQYKYELNYKVGEHNGEDEIYTVFFDWSDIAAIPNIILSHGIKEIDGDDYFWFRARKNNVSTGTHIIIDPIFGFEDIGTTGTISLQDNPTGGKFQMDSVGGLVTKLTAYLTTTGPNGDTGSVKCAIYDESSNLVAETNEIPDVHASKWYDFTLTTTPRLIASKWYYLYAVSDAGLGIKYTQDIGDDIKAMEINYNSCWQDPISTGVLYEDGLLSIYCTYTPVKTYTNKVPGKYIKVNKVQGKYIKVNKD